MKREVDLSRAILFLVEEHCPPEGGLRKPLAIDGYDAPTVAAHAELLIDEGLIEGRVMKELGRGPGHRIEVAIIRLTHSGHDALAAIRNDTVWQKAKKAAVEHAMPLTGRGRPSKGSLKSWSRANRIRPARKSKTDCLSAPWEYVAP